MSTTLDSSNHYILDGKPAKYCPVCEKVIYLSCCPSACSGKRCNNE